MPQVGFQYGAQQLTFAEAEVAAEQGQFDYPVPLIRAIAEQRTLKVPSASAIAGCLRQFELKKRVDYYARPGASLPSLFGTAWHSHMERYTPTGQQKHKELALAAEFAVDGESHTLTGQLDYLHEGEVLRDWKSKAYIPQGFTPPKGHKAQVNVYNVLAAENGYTPATHWELVYVSQSWLSRFSEPMAPLDATRRWISQRLSLWARSSAGGNLPAPLPEVLAVDAKGKPLAPCGYCEVREHCLAALKRDTPELSWEEPSDL